MKRNTWYAQSHVLDTPRGTAGGSLDHQGHQGEDQGTSEASASLLSSPASAATTGNEARRPDGGLIEPHAHLTHMQLEDEIRASPKASRAVSSVTACRSATRNSDTDDSILGLPSSRRPWEEEMTDMESSLDETSLSSLSTVGSKMSSARTVTSSPAPGGGRVYSKAANEALSSPPTPPTPR